MVFAKDTNSTDSRCNYLMYSLPFTLKFKKENTAYLESIPIHFQRKNSYYVLKCSILLGDLNVIMYSLSRNVL